MSQPIAGSRRPELEEVYRSCHGFLFALGYRMTGSADDARDIVQEAFVRAVERQASELTDSWRPWLARVVVNLSIDALRRRKRQRYAGPWLPQPLATGDDATEFAALADPGTPGLEAREPASRDTPEARYERLESASFAFLVALEVLTPAQRAALILHDVFDYSAREVARCIDTSEGNARVLLHRARRAMRGYDDAPCRLGPGLRERTRAALEEFLRCLIQQDAGGLERLLAEDVRTVTDSGGQYAALGKPLVGRGPVIRLYLRVAKRRAPGARIERRAVNGLPALFIEFESSVGRQAPRALLRCELDRAGRIRELHAILAADKLAAIDRAPRPDA
jgi:RNA polymerase sigma-70 factor (ECF subfamily)